MALVIAAGASFMMVVAVAVPSMGWLGNECFSGRNGMRRGLIAAVGPVANFGGQQIRCSVVVKKQTGEEVIAGEASVVVPMERM